MRILVTGAGGFVGRRLCRELTSAGHQVRAFMHNATTPPAPDCEIINGDIVDPYAVADAVRHIDAIVHLAARAHVMQESSSDPLAAYRRINVDGTRAIVEGAAGAGVSVLVFASSVKAVGAASTNEWDSTVTPNPTDPYGISKREAEIVVSAAPMATTILRFPLIYGPGVRGNVLRLFKMVDGGWPVPVSATPNARSLLFVGNATAAIRHIIDSADTADARAPSAPLFVCDGPPVSTRELVREIAEALEVTSRTVQIPVAAVRRVIDSALMPGLRASVMAREIIDRLAGSLVVNAQEFCDAFQFSPPFTRHEGLAETARWFRQR